MASGRQGPDGDKHDVDRRDPAGPSNSFVPARAAVDASVDTAVLVERRSVACALSMTAIGSAHSASLRYANSRAPPFTG
jgi:hypothetical protein